MYLRDFIVPGSGRRLRQGGARNGARLSMDVSLASWQQFSMRLTGRVAAEEAEQA